MGDAVKVLRDNLWLCADCLIVAVNGDTSGIDSEAQIADIAAGLERLGRGLVPNYDCETGEGIEDFMRAPIGGCSCCQSTLAGGFHRFALLGES